MSGSGQGSVVSDQNYTPHPSFLSCFAERKHDLSHKGRGAHTLLFKLLIEQKKEKRICGKYTPPLVGEVRLLRSKASKSPVRGIYPKPLYGYCHINFMSTQQRRLHHVSQR